MILVSGCLLGLDCKYNGGNNCLPLLEKNAKRWRLVPFCPEQLGGASTPRLPCEVAGGSGDDVLQGAAKVLNKDGLDMTKVFLKGAKEALKLAKAYGVTDIILKEKSPSCGVNLIYDGSFSGKTIMGSGVTASLLRNEGYRLWTEKELPGWFNELKG